MKDKFKTDFLFSAPSFWMGFGSVLSVGGHVHDYNKSNEPDRIAIANDWRMIGQDMQGALDKAADEAAHASGVEHERKQAA